MAQPDKLVPSTCGSRHKVVLVGDSMAFEFDHKIAISAGESDFRALEPPKESALSQDR